MSNKKWEVSVYFEHNENFVGHTTGGVCHIKVRQMQPTAESEQIWIDGTDLHRDQVFAFQDVCKKLGLVDIGKGGTKNTQYFQTYDPKMVNRALCMTKYAGKFGTTDKNEYKYRWWPADPEESINTRKCWRVSVRFTGKQSENGFLWKGGYMECRQLSVWVQQIRPKLEDRHYVAGGVLTLFDADEYARMAQKYPMNMVDFRMPEGGTHDWFSMSDSFETDDVDHVNKALLYTYYAGKFGTSEKTNYGYSWTG